MAKLLAPHPGITPKRVSLLCRPRDSARAAELVVKDRDDTSFQRQRRPPARGYRPVTATRSRPPNKRPGRGQSGRSGALRDAGHGDRRGRGRREPPAPGRSPAIRNIAANGILGTLLPDRFHRWILGGAISTEPESSQPAAKRTQPDGPNFSILSRFAATPKPITRSAAASANRSEPQI